jgi:starch synthase
MTYGTIPVVRRTGGLADTVEDAGEDCRTGTGFVFGEFSAAAFGGAVRRALAAYRDPSRWASLVGRAMATDWSWARSAAAYEALYRQVLARPPARAGDIGFPKRGLRP